MGECLRHMRVWKNWKDMGVAEVNCLSVYEGVGGPFLLLIIPFSAVGQMCMAIQTKARWNERETVSPFNVPWLM